MPTRHRGSSSERRALDAYIKLSRASAAVDARVNRPLAAHGLTVSQFGVLEALWHVGPLSQRELGAKILKSSGNMTMVIDNLCRMGLVRRVEDPADRRVRRIELTLRGAALVEDAMPEHVARIERTFACLSPAEQETLSELLRRLGRAAAQEADPAAAPLAHAHAPGGTT